MKYLTVNELAKASGVSVRTLHHYHEIGLLRPTLIGGNGYRYYGQDQVLRLQQILFWREFGVALADIGRILNQPDFDLIAALTNHRARLAADAQRISRILRTIDRTVAVLKGEREMKIDELYQGFAPEKQAEYLDWLDKQLNFCAGSKADEAHSQARGEELMASLRPIEAALTDAFLRGIVVGSPAIAPVLEEHRAWVGQSWGRECELAAYGRLADVYEHPDFRARFDTLAVGLSDWLISAMRAHAQR